MNPNHTQKTLEFLKEKYAGVMVLLEGGTRMPFFEFSAFEKDLIQALQEAEKIGMEKGIEKVIDILRNQTDLEEIAPESFNRLLSELKSKEERE